MQLWKQLSVIRPRPVVFGASSAPVRSCEERYILTRPSTRTRNIRRPGYSCFLFLSCSLLFFVCPLPSTAAVERKCKAETCLLLAARAASNTNPTMSLPSGSAGFLRDVVNENSENGWYSVFSSFPCLQKGWVTLRSHVFEQQRKMWKKSSCLSLLVVEW